jgi:hypothetical protein
LAGDDFHPNLDGQQGAHLEDVAPFVAAKYLGRSFRYMFVGEDDTLFFRDGAATAVMDADPTMPYYISGRLSPDPATTGHPNE